MKSGSFRGLRDAVGMQRKPRSPWRGTSLWHWLLGDFRAIHTYGGAWRRTHRATREA